MAKMYDSYKESGISPPIFETPERRQERIKVDTLFKNDKNFGRGKLFCLHEYVYFTNNQNFLEVYHTGEAYIVKCLKCGKEKKSSFMPIERLY